MPTYDYKCTNCDYAFELFQPMSAEPIKECPKCKGVVKRLIGMGAGPIFKGTGFYQTDYKNKSNDAGKKEGTKSSPKVTKPETTADSKPAEKNTEPKK